MTQPRYWALVPAAGVGRRMQSDLPKQYLPLLGKTVIEHSLERLLALPIESLIIALDAADAHFAHLPISHSRSIEVVEGGAERHLSVYKALLQLTVRAAPEDWVLVHDAVRPCVSSACIQSLMQAVADDPAGGLLGYPLADTLKRVDQENQVQSTVDRSGMWAAATPQLFRYGILREALQQLIADNALPTDEAMAVERLGYRPRMVAGRRDNIKITVPGDLELAALILQAQQGEAQQINKQQLQREERN